MTHTTLNNIEVKASETIVSKTNIRKAKAVKGIEELAQDILLGGQIQPVIVRLEGDKLAVIAGQRRRMAVLLLEKTNPEILLKCIEVDVDDTEAKMLSLSENIGQSAMTSLQYSRAFKMLKDQGICESEIAKRYSMEAIEISKHLAIGALPEVVIAAFENGDVDDSGLKFLAVSPKSIVSKWIKLLKDGDAPYREWGIKQLANIATTISPKKALFDVDASKLVIIVDIFNDNKSFFADPDAFWVEQEKAIEIIKAEHEGLGWPVVVSKKSYYYSSDYKKTSKAKGGQVKILCETDGTVTIKKGYLTLDEIEALKNKSVTSEGVEGETVQSNQKAELTLKANDYLSTYMSQGIRSVIMNDYDLVQRMLLIGMLEGSGEISRSNHSHFSSTVDKVCGGELFNSKSHRETAEFTARSMIACGLNADENLSSWEQDDHYDLLQERVLALPISDVQNMLTVLAMENVSGGNYRMTMTYQLLGIDLKDVWDSENHTAFFGLINGRDNLLTLLTDIAGEGAAEEVAGNKIKDIRVRLIDEARLRPEWKPPYFKGEVLGNGQNAPYKNT